jgi:hypothetical protein
MYLPYYHMRSGYLFISLVCYATVYGGPIVINGTMIPDFIGTAVSSVRVINDRGSAVPFQIDEKTNDGEYICPEGKRPNTNSANGRFDPQDEIVFLWEDGDSCGTGENICDKVVEDPAKIPVTIAQGSVMRRVWIAADSSLPLSTVSYCAYDPRGEYLQTPYYYAQFAHNRFHFTRAGVMNFESGDFIDLTKELRVEMVFKILWGLIPVRFTEESIVCHVQRYKAGPVRLIRRGDFYINLGFGIKGSRAVVYQMCYPDVVKVPVMVTVPVRFRSVCSDAYIEMTPVIRKEVAEKCFHFTVPKAGYSCELSSGRARVDTLIRILPEKGYVISDGRQGYGWIARVGVDSSLLSGSGLIMRRPSKRGGIAECGFKLTVWDLPKGKYDVVNWVLFSRYPLDAGGRDLLSMLDPASIMTPSGTFSNFLFCREEKIGLSEKSDGF